MIDRFVVASLAAMYAFFPLYGTFASFAPHPPTAPLVPRGVAIGIAGILAIALAGVTAGAVLRRRSRPVVRLWLLANVAATYLGAACGFDPAVGLGLATVIAGMVAAHFTLLAYYREPGTARTVYLALLGSGLAASLLALALLLLKRPADLYAFNHGRAVGTFLNPNEFAEYLLLYLSAAAGLAMVRRGTPVGAFAALCTAVGGLAFALTFSRWGLVAAGAGIAAFAVAARPRRGLSVAAGALAAIVALNVVLAATHHEPQDTASRDVAWRAGLSTWLHFPLTGVGPLAFERLYPVMRAPDAPGPNTPVAFDPHDLPLSILAETGILGLTAFAVSLATFLARLPGLATRAPAEHRTLAFSLFAGIVAVAVHMLLNSASIAFGLFIQFTALALAAASWGYESHAA
ncbi:MAG: O-antigen ligase family protein [Candidatus Velthaea sp.]